MKICVIHGSPRKGNTYRATEILKEEVQKYGKVEFTEFFLPRDMPHFCCGCYRCFEKGEEHCPHARYTQPIAQAIREADGIIVTTPVYSLAESGAVKAMLDHFSYLFMNHRPMEEMFTKIAVVISTTAGIGTNNAIKTVKRALRYWGMKRVIDCGLGIYAKEWDEMKPEKQLRLTRVLQLKARRFCKLIARRERLQSYAFTRIFFRMSKDLINSFPEGNTDKKYWEEKGWLYNKERPY